jgi:hypothetical protein
MEGLGQLLTPAHAHDPAPDLLTGRGKIRIKIRITSKKKPELLCAARAFKNITPQMPFRRISRSLSVTGG